MGKLYAHMKSNDPVTVQTKTISRKAAQEKAQSCH